MPEKRLRRASGILLLAGISLMLLRGAPGGVSAAAATIVVNDTGDNLHDPGCATTGTGTCTLRDAITFANANTGHDTISFNLPGSGVRTISPATALPTLSGADGVTIDGYTQPGATANSAATGSNAVLLVALEGSGAAGVDGLVLASSGNTVRGLVIGGFGPGASGIAVAAGSGNVIAGNLIGTTPGGSTADANATGVALGTGTSGTTVGGSGLAARNVISGNGPGHGVLIEGTSNGNTVSNNVIGLGANGATALGNSGWGILVAGSASGNTLGPGNVLTDNVLGGVGITGTGTGNTVQGNTVYGNGGPGIDLGGDGVTANDTNDADSGPNGLQNAPVLQMALRSPTTGQLVLRVAQDSRLAAGTNHINVYLAETATAVRGPGKTPILVFDVAAGASTTTTIPLTPGTALGATDWVTATATTADGTSEFAQNTPVAANLLPIASAGPDQTVAVNAIVTLDGSASNDPDGLPSGSGIADGAFTWTQTAGIAVDLENPQGANPSFEAVFGGVYEFSLAVSDGLDTSVNVATVTITVTDTTTPVAHDQTLNIRSNQAKGVHPTATDPDNTKFIWAIASQPAHGRLNGFNDRTGGVIYIPDYGYEGEDSFTMTASDGVNVSLPATITFHITGFVTIVSPPALPKAAKGTPYAVTLLAQSGVPPYTWAISAGLPPGLALNTLTGAITGTPSTAGVYTFTAKVTDGLTETDSETFTIEVTAPPARPFKLRVAGVAKD
ncbi:MAG: right-handed parallel beta-helix repeat-containing protein [Chloroflexi bacterium]|nr:right-handed parallel beta-helix repeat-containing protein [Chloroflexota bacterium]